MCQELVLGALVGTGDSSSCFVICFVFFFCFLLFLFFFFAGGGGGGMQGALLTKQSIRHEAKFQQSPPHRTISSGRRGRNYIGFM